MYEIHQHFFMNVSFPSHETELSIPKVIHQFFHEFGKSNVSRV
jgi:hypothetical protein